MHEATALLEPDDLLHMPDGESYELVDGHLAEKKMGARSEEIGGNIFASIHNHVRPQRLGHVFGSQTAYRCFPSRPRLLRKPDVSLVLRGRFQNEEAPAGEITIVPDLTVEVTSPNNSYDEVEVKVSEYLEAGVRLVWVVCPATKSIIVRRPNKTANTLDVNDSLSGEDVLPGFSCSVGEVFS